MVRRTESKCLEHSGLPHKCFHGQILTSLPSNLTLSDLDFTEKHFLQQILQFNSFKIRDRFVFIIFTTFYSGGNNQEEEMRKARSFSDPMCFELQMFFFVSISFLDRKYEIEKRFQISQIKDIKLDHSRVYNPRDKLLRCIWRSTAGDRTRK